MTFLKSLRSAGRGAQKAAGDAQQALSELRALRLRLLDQRADLASRPLPLSEAQDAATAAVQRAAEQALDDLRFASLTRPSDGRTPRLDLTENQIAALAFAANAEAISDLIRARVAQRYQDGPEPLAVSDRERALAKIDSEILSAEMAEEATVRELERSGFDVARRPDADPRALLAADAELK